MRCLVVLATANALQQRYFASTARGCEPYLADELASLGASHVEIGRSGVLFDGDTRVGYAALIQCRTATKVLEVLAWRNGVETAADLYNLGRDVPWPELMDVEGTLRVDATLTGGVSQALAHSHFSSLTLKNAVVDSFRGENQLGRRPSVAKDDCDVPLHLFLDRDRCTLYRSLSSESLHKRGYRSRTSHRAALRPTVAAAMLYGARWPQRSMRGEACGCMCGSGTLLIGGGPWRAHRAGPAAGGERGLRLRTVEGLRRSMRDEVVRKREAALHILRIGADAHAGAAGLARDGIANAGVENDVTAQVADCLEDAIT